MLNAEGMPSPRARESGRYNGGRWNPSTLSGSIELGEGILNNALYIGRRIFNRRTWIEVPTETRGFRRQPRLNSEAEWIVRDEPHLRIIDQDLWTAVKARQLEARRGRDEKFKLTGNPLAGSKRAAHLLSGLVTCGACDDMFIATGAGRWRCKGHRRDGCVNGSVTTTELEERVLAGIRQRLLTPDLVRRFTAELQQELEAAYRAVGSDRQRIEVELVDARRRIARLVRRIEDDEDAPRALVQRLKELELTEAQLVGDLATVPEQATVRLPANYDTVYQRAVAELEAHLAGEDGNAACEAIRALVQRVIVQPGDARGGKRRRMQLQGDLFAMLDFAEEASKGVGTRTAKLPRTGRSEGVVLPLVAGTCSHFDLLVASRC